MTRKVVVSRTAKRCTRKRSGTSMKPRSAVATAAVALAGALAVCGCASTQLGAAAVTSSSRITVSTLTAKVANLNSAYAADKKKGISPQRPVGQATQQVLTWLILFQVYDQMAKQHGISVTQSDIQAAQRQYTAQAKQSNVTVQQYWSAGGALPPSLLPELDRAGAIQTVLAAQFNGGTTPTTSAEQAAVEKQLSKQQCLAAKSLDIHVNPQYGVYDYSGFSVAAVPSVLAADPTPAAAPTALRTSPTC
jgi:hypothetical protein